jgi:hypothetical protein
MAAECSADPGQRARKRLLHRSKGREASGRDDHGHAGEFHGPCDNPALVMKGLGGAGRAAPLDERSGRRTRLVIGRGVLRQCLEEHGIL